MKKVLLLLVSFVFLVGIIVDVSATAETEKFTVPVHVEFPDEYCSDVPVFVVIDGVQSIHIATNDNSIHFNIKTEVETKILDPGDLTNVIATEQVSSKKNENINKNNTTLHLNHIFKGQFADGSEWHGVLVEMITINANGDVVVDFERENFINCP